MRPGDTVHASAGVLASAWPGGAVGAGPGNASELTVGVSDLRGGPDALRATNLGGGDEGALDSAG
jgi:hypothetical protein